MIGPPKGGNDLPLSDAAVFALIEKAVGEKVIPLTESRFRELQALVEGVVVNDCDVTSVRLEDHL